MLLHVVSETDAGIVVRGAKYETAAAYANQAFIKPTIANWGNEELSDYARRLHLRPGRAGPEIICRTGFAGRAPIDDYPLANRFDEVDTLVDLRRRPDPLGERPLLPPHAAAHLHPRDAAPLLRLRLRAAQPAARRHADRRGALQRRARPGSTSSRPCRRSSRSSPCYREGINAHLTAAIALAETSPAGLLMPNQSLLYTGRVLACSQLHEMMHIARELCGGQICVTPDAATFEAPETRPWLEKFYSRQRELGGRGPPQAAGLRARPPELRLCRPPADVPALRAVAALRAPRRRLPQLRLGRPAGDRQGRRRPVRPACVRTARPARRQREAGDERPHRAAGGHVRIRPFNTARHLSRAAARQRPLPGRGRRQHGLPARPGRRRISTPARTSAIGDPAAQTEKVMDNIELLLARVRRRARAHRRPPRLPDRHPLPRGRLPGARASSWRACSRSSPASSSRRWRGPSGWSRSTRDRGRIAVTFSLAGALRADRHVRRRDRRRPRARPSPRAARYARAGVGAACSQNVTDPRLGPRLLDLLAGGRRRAGRAGGRRRATAPHVDLPPADGRRRAAAARRPTPARHARHARRRTRADCVAAGNLLADDGRAARRWRRRSRADPEAAPRRPAGRARCGPGSTRAARRGRCTRRDGARARRRRGPSPTCASTGRRPTRSPSSQRCGRSTRRSSTHYVTRALDPTARAQLRGARR